MTGTVTCQGACLLAVLPQAKPQFNLPRLPEEASRPGSRSPLHFRPPKRTFWGTLCPGPRIGPARLSRRRAQARKKHVCVFRILAIACPGLRKTALAAWSSVNGPSMCTRPPGTRKTALPLGMADATIKTGGPTIQAGPTPVLHRPEFRAICACQELPSTPASFEHAWQPHE